MSRRVAPASAPSPSTPGVIRWGVLALASLCALAHGVRSADASLVAAATLPLLAATSLVVRGVSSTRCPG